MGYPYGKDFRYSEAVIAGKRIPAVLTSAGLKLLLAGAAWAPTRRLMRLVLPAPGTGPSPEKREQGFFKILLLGRSDDSPPVEVRGTVKGARDPGYSETSKMLAESALCLAFDDLPERGGILTPASCMGLHLIERLRRAGMTFEVG